MTHNSTLPPCKSGKCIICNDGVDKNCRKVGKLLYCLYHYNFVGFEEKINKANKISLTYGAKQKSSLPKSKDKSIANIIDDLDSVFSRYIRLKYADDNGICICYTCDISGHFTFMQCGHFIKRSAHNGLRVDERNNRVQCKICNENKGGNYEIYTERLENEYPGLPQQLLLESRDVYNFTRSEVMELLMHYRQKLKLVNYKSLIH